MEQIWCGPHRSPTAQRLDPEAIVWRGDVSPSTGARCDGLGDSHGHPEIVRSRLAAVSAALRVCGAPRCDHATGSQSTRGGIHATCIGMSSASLFSRGGLGLRSAVLTANAAYWATCCRIPHCCGGRRELVRMHLPGLGWLEVCVL